MRLGGLDCRKMGLIFNVKDECGQDGAANAHGLESGDDPVLVSSPSNAAFALPMLTMAWYH